jgi:hypothetical protein
VAAVTITADHLYARMQAGLEQNIIFKIGDDGAVFNNFTSLRNEIYTSDPASIYMSETYVEYCAVADLNVPIVINEIGVFRDDIMIAYTFLSSFRLEPGRHIITLRLNRNDGYTNGFIIT